MNYEIPLVLFTTFTQIAVGLSLFTAWRQYAGGAAAATWRREWLLVWLLASVGLVFSLFHLGKPLMAPTALKNIGTAWLSREGLIFGLFTGMAFICLFLKTSKTLGAATAVVGLLGIVAQGMTYAAPSMPAINNVYPLLWFVMAALICGAALFMAAGNQGLSGRLLSIGSALFLFLLLGIPGFWISSDNSVVRETAGLWFASPFYWGAVACIGLALLVSAMRMNAKISFALCAAGVLLSRLVFFGATVHTATNIGGIY